MNEQSIKETPTVQYQSHSHSLRLSRTLPWVPRSMIWHLPLSGECPQFACQLPFFYVRMNKSRRHEKKDASQTPRERNLSQVKNAPLSSVNKPRSGPSDSGERKKQIASKDTKATLGEWLDSYHWSGTAVLAGVAVKR
jgi:hypothetical protein